MYISFLPRRSSLKQNFVACQSKVSHLFKKLNFLFGLCLQVGSSYLRRMYRRYDEFMRIREKVDPDQIFFNRYWMRIMDEDHFGE